jgi:alpha-beta hydrolase superfamily lysophospholipase
MLNVYNPLPPVLRQDPGSIVFRGLAHVLRTSFPIDLDPSQRLLTPPADGLHTVRPVAIPVGDHAMPGHLFLPKAATGGAVALVHGTTAEKVVPYYFFIRALLRAGVQVLTFELDGHGDNPRPLCIHSIEECVPAALRFLREQPEVNGARVGMMGVSLGGACALHAAARDPAIRAVATISTPHSVCMDDWNRLLEALGVLNPELLPSCLEATPNRLLEFLGTSMRVASTLDAAAHEEMDLLHPGTLTTIDAVVRHLDPLGAAASLSETPVLVVNGEWDQITPAWQAEDIYYRAAGPRAIALVPRRNHFTIMTSRLAVETTVNWFRRWL